MRFMMQKRKKIETLVWCILYVIETIMHRFIKSEWRHYMLARWFSCFCLYGQTYVDRRTRRGPPRGKRDGVIGHISRRENVNWMWKLALLRERSTWRSAWLDKLGVNMNFRQFLGVICAKILRESGISRPPWRAPDKQLQMYPHAFLLLFCHS